MGNSLQKVIEFIKTSSPKRTIGILIILIIAAAIPLTVIISQQQQEIRQKAAGSSTRVCGLYGDVNGDTKIDKSDADTALLLASSNPKNTYDDHLKRLRAHVTWDGTDSDKEQVDPTDALQILRYIESGDSSGFTACNFIKPAPMLTEIVRCGVGDMDGDKYITSLDSYNISAILIGWLDQPASNSAMMITGDVDNDGQITVKDAQLIEKFRTGQISSFTRQCVKKPLVCGNLGNVDGDGWITGNDALEILRYVAGLPPYYNYVAQNADTDGNTKVEAIDALALLRYLANLSSAFPPSSCSGLTSTPASTPALTPTSGNAISGTVFIDDGRDGGTASDGLKNGGEIGYNSNGANVVSAVKMGCSFNCISGNAPTDSNGNYSITIPDPSYAYGYFVHIPTFPAGYQISPGNNNSRKSVRPPAVENFGIVSSATAGCPNGNISRIGQTLNPRNFVTTANTPLGFDYTVGTGSNKLLLVGINLRTSSGGSITSVKYNGVSLTRLGIQDDTGYPSSPTGNSFWYALDAQLPNDGIPHPLLISANTSLTISAGASSWANVNQTTPFGSYIVKSGTTSPATLTGDGASCGVVVDNLATAIESSSDPVPDSSQFPLWGIHVPRGNLGGGAGQSGGSYKEATSQITMTWPLSPVGVWILKAVPLIAAGTNPLPPKQCDSGEILSQCEPNVNSCDGSGTQTRTYTTRTDGQQCIQWVESGIACNTAPPNCTPPNVCNANRQCVLRTPTPTPTPTSTPTRTPTSTPTLTPPVTSTIPAGSTVFSLNIGLDGLGSTGDNANPGNSSGSNKNPIHQSRNITIQVFNNNNTEVANKSGTLNYNTNTGKFEGNVDMGNLTSGTYNVKVKSSGYLRRLVAGIQNVTGGQKYNLPATNLVTGDINGDNAINILDYNIFISCSIFSGDNQTVCNQNPDYKKLSDLDDNGEVNQFDYNLFVRELSVQNGD